MITVLGLGPGSLSRVPGPTRTELLDQTRPLVVRTINHPAAEELSKLRDVVFCDDLYEAAETFDDVYQAIVERLLSIDSDVMYAVPGSPLIGEFAVRRLLESDAQVEVIPAESFVDAVLGVVGYDPLDRGLQILNGHELPDPLVLDKPTLIAHLDRPEILANVADAVGRVTRPGQLATVLFGIGSDEESISQVDVDEIDFQLAGVRTSLFVDPQPSGLVGAVHLMRRLRDECPWDRDQTHESLVKNLVEETFELVDAIASLESEEDWVGYAGVEEELGDVLLQVLFHASIARERGVFDVDGVASVLVEKLVRRHPHVFGDVTADSPEQVKSNWDEIKAAEKPEQGDSAVSGVPTSMPALHRAAKIQNRAAKSGFDWDRAEQVLPKVSEELGELENAIAGSGDIESELGDLLFTVVNLSRHLGLDPETSLRRATDRFESRFRTMESEGSLSGMTLDQLDERWERAKRADGA